MQTITLDNYHAAFAIMCQVQQNTWSEQTFIDSISGANTAVQLVQAGQVLGFYIVMAVQAPRFIEWSLLEIAVTPDRQQQGIGTALMQELIKRAQAQQVDEIWLEVRQSNAAARHLYTRFDFAQIEVRKDYYPALNPSQDEQREHAVILRWMRC